MSSVRHPRPKRRNYDDAAVNLLRMIDIAVESCDYITNCYDGYQDVRRGELHGLRQRVLQAPPEMRNLRVLNAVQRELLRHYYCMYGEPDIEFFWTKAEDECLAERRDHVARALERSRIVGRDEHYCIEYMYMKQYDEGHITKTQMRKVERMLDAFIHHRGYKV